ncbi:MAG: GAF domain-containing protein, partial [Proteobacteria bacterium]
MVHAASFAALAFVDLPEAVFDNITFLASQICDTPIALISLVDETRQWFKSKVGLDASETPREISFCGHAILHDARIFEVHDAFADERFADNPLTLGQPHVRFYAGATLQASNGEKLGTLCVIDSKPRALSENQQKSLSALADQVMALIEARKAALDITNQRNNERTLALEVDHERKRLQTIFDSSPSGLAIVREPDFIFEKFNAMFATFLNANDFIGKKWSDYKFGKNDGQLVSLMNVVYETGQRHTEEELEITLFVPGVGTKKRYFQISFDRIEYSNESNYSLLIQTIDITENVEARNLIKESQRLATEARNRLYKTLESVPIGVALT